MDERRDLSFRFLSVIMAFAGQDYDYVPNDFVGQTIGIVDAAAPKSGQVMLQRFRLAYTVEGIPAGIFDKGVDPL